jgi:glutamate---cysteine ligase / carboxylate-amine ligase
VNPHTWELAPARDVFDALRTHVEPALRDAGDWEWTADAFDRLMAQGTGSARERSAYEVSGSVDGVVKDLITRTPGWRPRLTVDSGRRHAPHRPSRHEGTRRSV